MLTTARIRGLSSILLPRWAVVAALAVALLTLGNLVLAVAEMPPRLGVRAEARDGRVMLTRVDPGGLAWDVGLRPGDVVTTLDGRAAVPADAAAVADARRVEGRLASGTLAVASTRAADATAARRQVSFSLLAFWFIFVGGATFVLAGDLAAAAMLLVGTASAAIALLAALATPYGARWALALVFVALTSFGAAIFLFFLHFPLDRTGARVGRAAAACCLTLHAALLLAYVGVATVAPAAYAWLLPAWQATFLADILAACGLAVAAWWSVVTTRREMRASLAVAVLGLGAGTLPFGLLTLLPPLLGAPRPVPPDLAALSFGFLPSGLALALLSRRYLGITRLVRRGLVASVVWLGLLGVSVVALDAVRQRLETQQPPLAAVFSSTLTIGVLFAGAFPLAQGALRRALERRLFPDHYDPAATLRQFGAALVVLPSGELDALAGELLTRLAATLDLTWCALALRAPGAAPFGWWTRGPIPVGLAPHDLLSADADGGAATLGTGDDRALVVPLIAAGAPVGALALGPKRHDVELLPRDAAFVAALAPLAATALLGALRARQLAAQVAALAEREATLAALSARLLTAQEEERRRIALELHDDPLQRVTLLARLLERADGAGMPPAARLALEEIGAALRAICVGLRPPVLDDLGLVAALGWLAEEAQARAEEPLAIAVRADATAEAGLDPALGAALFRVAQEALNNVVKHARAASVELALTREGGRLCLRIADDGRGAGAPAMTADGRPAAGLGLAGMRERLRPWGGMVAVTARPGGGMLVAATVPLGEAA